VPVWIAVFLTPAALLSLRLIDDTGVALLVPGLLAAMVVIFLAVLAVAVRASATRSMGRALGGGASAVAAAALLALPMIHVIGQRACPEWMGADRGTEASMQMLEAWRRAEAAPAALWEDWAEAEAWKARAGRSELLDYKHVSSGCWERLAPVASTKTWHEFRVTVREPDGDRFSKTVVVHTRATREGWRISEVDGPGPS
jgi:hypothetical protein